MNETLNTLLNRRSIRKYRHEPVAGELLEQILTAGLYAPSARNKQPWHLTVIRKKESLVRLTEEVRTATLRMPENPYAAMVQRDGYSVNFNAPCMIIVSADPAESLMVQADCALLLGNMFLAAFSLGVGSCWVNQLGILSDEPGFRAVLDKLGVPSRNRVYGCAALGYPEGDYPVAALRREGTVVYGEI